MSCHSAKRPGSAIPRRRYPAWNRDAIAGFGFAAAGWLDQSMRIIQTVIQLPAPQRIEKSGVILEPPSNTTPNNLGLRLLLRESGNQDMEAVATSAALVMHDVVIARNRSPDEAFAWERGVRDNIGRL